MPGEEPSTARLVGWACLATLTVAFATSAWAARPPGVPVESPIEQTARNRALHALAKQIAQAAEDGQQAELDRLESTRCLIAADPVRRLGSR